jgi:hypothetical protein
MLCPENIHTLKYIKSLHMADVLVAFGIWTEHK